MGTVDTAKEVIRLASTAGLSKDVIDLMEKKIFLLTDEIRVLADKCRMLSSERDVFAGKNAELSSRVSNLEMENQQLRGDAGDTQPKMEEHMGVLWKRTASGFEPHPYCNHCPHHPIMRPVPNLSCVDFWTCDNDHNAPGSITAPNA